MRSFLSVLLFGLCVTALAAPAWSQPAAPAPWPRTFTKGGDTIIAYQPQIDSWKDYSTIRFRMAVVVVPSGGTPEYGAVAVQAHTDVDNVNRVVMLSQLDIAVRFAGLADDKAAPLKALVTSCFPSASSFAVPLDNVLAYQKAVPTFRTANVSLKPPTIYFSTVPAILVQYMGQPQFKAIAGTQLMFIANCNWLVLMDMAANQYYLLDGQSWLTAPDPVNGPWTIPAALPAGFAQLPADQWPEVAGNLPGTHIKVVPRVITSTTPAELIVTLGQPAYESIPGTRLFYVSNPVMPLFLCLVDDHYYYLVAGRWFKAPTLNGPWAEASNSLPAEFGKIPPNSPMGPALACVPGTQEAQNAALTASIPHRATVNIAGAKCNVAFDGRPNFAPIPGTQMTYATNSPNQIICVNGQYYCCYQGVWFVAQAPTGPYAVCTSVPQDIYTIPSSSPVYNVTYCQVYGSTPTTVDVGYTGGYDGDYVAPNGVLVYGAGALAAAYADTHGYYYPGAVSYGCGALYNPAYGGYYRAAQSACYGPYGGAGYGAVYSSGAYVRPPYAPAGETYGYAARAYNPYAGSYGAHVAGESGYAAWGDTAAAYDGKWAAAGHETTAAGTSAWAQTSSGAWAQAYHRQGGGTAVATSGGDIYAGPDGNVYKNTGGSWEKYTGGGAWQSTAWGHTPYTQTASSAKTEQEWGAYHTAATTTQSEWHTNYNANYNWKNSWESGGSANAYATQHSLYQDSWSRGYSGGSAYHQNVYGGSSAYHENRYGGGSAYHRSGGYRR